MFSITSYFNKKSTQSSIDANHASEESQEILTLEDLVEILEKLDQYLQTT
ncbi:hypothetical protein [Anabaena catenula]|uniref:Uncharacterized protein n=1 Tax=Anabaena catenula FACHB-362 TaxID=2692877 RepID=A0ABR8IZ15_9NOST|nr:hypothetical protein [Anabaena catenula]MBD2690409.1 hypothetical protein [Anabaena catenula FACHB-362]